MAELNFIDEIAKDPECKDVRKCIQCGTCSATCPVGTYMQHTPRELFAMIRTNMKDEVLSSNTMWYCASCYSCAVRCPKKINITEVMYTLKRLTFNNNGTKNLLTPFVKRKFINNIFRHGRIYEPGFVASYLHKVSMGELVGYARLCLELIMKGRLFLIPKKVKNIQGLKRIINKAATL